MDKIGIRGLKVFARHGVLAEENRKGQTFFVSADLYLDTGPAAEADDLGASADYGAVCRMITSCLRERTYRLIETAARDTACRVLAAFPVLRGLKLRLYKPEAPIGLPFETVFVETTVKWHRAYLGLGSNLGDRRALIERAVGMLRTRTDIRVLRQSDLIETRPYGYIDQGDFLNGCLQIETMLTPQELLRILNTVEAELGVDRRVKIHWGPRTIDLDILLYDALVLDEENLTIPHRDLQNRAFVLQPLAQIGGFERHPLLGRTVAELWQALRASKEAAE